MTTQEAIRVLRERAHQNYLKTQPRFLAAVRLSIVALQEKQEREGGQQP